MKKTNELGYSFEIEETLTKYAQEDVNKSDHIVKGLGNNIVVLEISKEDTHIGYILFDTNTQTPLSKEMGLEQLACYIDVLKYLKSTEE